MMNLSIAIAHFLNCFLYSGQVSNPIQGIDEVSGKTVKRDFKLLFTEQKQQEAQQTSRQTEPTSLQRQ